jgi:hypothetical protein
LHIDELQIESGTSREQANSTSTLKIRNMDFIVTPNLTVTTFCRQAKEGPLFVLREWVNKINIRTKYIQTIDLRLDLYSFIWIDLLLFFR